MGRSKNSTCNDLAPFLFHQGTNYQSYAYLGCHPCDGGFVFRVWAPHAESVRVVGSFNAWQTDGTPMTKVTDGVWEQKRTDVRAGDLYKYYIKNGERELWKADPYGFAMQKPPETASVVCGEDTYVWHDEGWMDFRKGKFDRTHVQSQPINIYELHLGSWKKKDDGEYLTYGEIARELIPYVKQMGYTHVELMPVAEHPFDGSWGYQVCGYYAPSARFGDPDGFRALVDDLHRAGVGVILDWVPAHFPKDAHGLCEFDGSYLYEYQGADRREHAGWGTRCFDVGRQEVQSFLISNAVYFAREFHVDGLRVDAVASMLYLDYDRKPGEWIPNVYGDNKNLEAIAFFKKLNGVMAHDYPDVMMIAEESTAFGEITRESGLNFTLKWNMGWMNDSLSYLSEDPLWRCDHHNNLTFPITYQYSERYVMPISHDEVVHGKKTLLDRAVGDYDQKFASLRTYLTYMMTHPGKKLLFMGCEIGQFAEWDEKKSVEWFLLDYPRHAETQKFVSDLNALYLAHPCLWQKDDDVDGFEWIDADNKEQSVYSYRRRDRDGRELMIILNFLPIERKDFLLAVPFDGEYREVFNSDQIVYGGKGIVNVGILKTQPALLRNYARAVNITLPAMSALIFECVRQVPNKKYRSRRTEK